MFKSWVLVSIQRDGMPNKTWLCGLYNYVLFFISLMTN